MITFEQIEEADQRAESLRDQYLREHGWDLTSKTPVPCYWLWIKVIDGERYTLPTDMALTIERGLST
jgi:hypothetical protein